MKAGNKISRDALTIKCPKFNSCSAPLCPLDIDYNKRSYLKGEPRCSLRRAKRLKYGSVLPNKGLFPKEYSALKRWQSKSEEERTKFIKNATDRLKNFRGSKQAFNNLSGAFKEFNPKE
jgi:hypothetical protein